MKNILYGCILLLFLYSCKKTNNCSDSVDVYGCMDSTATNYDSLATIEDSSCWVVSVNVTPNPSDGVFNVEVFAKDTRNLKITILSNVGQEVFTSGPEEFTGKYVKEVNLTGNDFGIYFMQVFINDDKFLKKLVLTD